MKVALLAVATNIHTMRWVNALAERDIPVMLITQQPPIADSYHPSVEMAILPYRGRFAYALNAPALRRLFHRSQANFLHVHYAGGYGAMVWLSGIRERIISVWGGDVYHVPLRSPLHRLCVVRALKGAVRITSTSHVMAEQVRRLGIAANIDVIPFGVNTQLFSPPKYPAPRSRLVVGTVKTLQPKYGIDTLIRGFALALKDADFARLEPELRIYGSGEARAEYERLAQSLGVEQLVEFAGAIRHEDVPAALRGLDIYVAVSRNDSESFGVAVIEASACGLPVVVSDAGGLPEVVVSGGTGLVLPRNDPERLADALCQLAQAPDLRQRLGAAGRARVVSCYEWKDCVDRMIALYGEVMASPSVARSDEAITGKDAMVCSAAGASAAPSAAFSG